jgi:hypothetical protein
MNEPERPRNARQLWPAGNNSRSRTKICQFGKHFRSFGGTVDRSRWICAPGLIAPRLKPDGRLSIGCTICCEACGTAVPAYDVVSYGSIEKGYRELCSRCLNAEVASALGLERFENVRLHPEHRRY